jgi:hypothetical protein
MKSITSLILVCAFLSLAPLSMAAETDSATGTVVETIEAGGYVYLKLEEQGTWIAANTFKVSKGDKIQYSGGMEMKGFHSKSLDRTFDSIYFVSKASLVGQGGKAQAAVASMPADHATNAMPPGKPAAVQAPVAGEIKHLKDGQTVEAVFANSENLKEQVVSVNARVIKINKDIMGRNWITLQDGTGDEPNHKLLATSQQEVSPGDIVTAKGTVKTDIDLGYGYSYKVLLEEVTFTPGVE